MSSEDKYKPDRPVFVGNFHYDATVDEIEELLEKYGPVERVELKTGFAFVYMKDKRDGEDAIRDLEGKEWGYKRRRLKMDWARGDTDVKRREEKRRRQADPTTTLFVVNFDVMRTRERDLADKFGRYGPLTRVQIKKNFAFVQFEEVRHAEKALKDIHDTMWNGRIISVEYVAREADGRALGEPAKPYEARRADRERYRSRTRSRSPRRRSRRSRSRTPPRRSRRRSPTPYSRSRSRTPRRRDSRSPSRSVSRSRSPRRGRRSGRSPSRSPRRSASPRPRRSPRRSASPALRRSASLSPRRSASLSPRRSISR